jgi:hypothetical protein
MVSADPVRPRPKRAAPIALTALVLAVAATARIAWFPVADRSPDEQLWTEFGAGISRQGPAYVTHLVRAFNRDEDVEYPWAQRAGYSCLVGLVMRASGDTTVHATEALSTGASLGAVAGTGAIALDLLDPWVAPITALFFAASPLDLALARRAWQDDVMALLTVLMLWSFLRHAARGRRASLVAFLALSAFALTIKESAVIPYGIGVLGLAWIAWRRARRPAAVVAALAWGALPALAAGAAIVAIAGGPGELRHVLELAREANAPDEYMRHYQSGGPGYYLVGLGLLQPVPFALGSVAMLLALARPAWLAPGPGRATGRASLVAIAALVAGFAAVAFAYSSKNMRFLSPIYGPVFLLAAALVHSLVGAVRSRVPRAAGIVLAAVAAVALAGSAALDLRRFDHYFNELQIQDLATPWFTETTGSDE